MNTVCNNHLSFRCISIQEGGTDFVEKEGGIQAIELLEQAKKAHSNTGWNLYVQKDRYALKSPTTGKTYEGPFSIKRQIRTQQSQDKPKLIIRLDNLRRVKYAIEFPTVSDVSKAYKAIKGSVGFKKILTIFELLETQYQTKRKKIFSKL